MLEKTINAIVSTVRSAFMSDHQVCREDKPNSRGALTATYTMTPRINTYDIYIFQSQPRVSRKPKYLAGIPSTSYYHRPRACPCPRWVVSRIAPPPEGLTRVVTRNPTEYSTPPFGHTNVQQSQCGRELGYRPKDQ
jgi:hypothetical protein